MAQSGGGEHDKKNPRSSLRFEKIVRSKICRMKPSTFSFESLTTQAALSESELLSFVYSWNLSKSYDHKYVQHLRPLYSKNGSSG